MMTVKKRIHNTIILSLLLFIFIAPLFFAFFLYRKNPYWLHQNTVNQGQLIKPPIYFFLFRKRMGLQPVSLSNRPLPPPLDRNRYRIKPGKTHWLLVYLTPTPCNQRCQKNLHEMGQIHKALGKNSHRLDGALVQVVVKKSYKMDTSLKKTLEDSKLFHYAITSSDLEPFSSLHDKSSEAYYLVDPLGRVILSYPKGTPGKAIYEDISRLLTHLTRD